MHVAALIMQRDAEAQRSNDRATLRGDRGDSDATLCPSPKKCVSPPLPLPLSKLVESEYSLTEAASSPAQPCASGASSPAPPGTPGSRTHPPSDGRASPTPTALSRLETHPGPFPDLHLAAIPTCKEEVEYGPPPDGGRDAWLCVLSGALLFLTMFGFVTSMGQLQGFYLSHQLSSYSQPTVAWIATVQSTLTFFPSLFFGRLFDAHGPLVLVIAGTSLSFSALVAVAFCREYYHFLLAHALFGFATSVIWGPSASVCGHWFARRRATAIGIVGCGSGIGGIIYPILLKNLLDHFSFRDAILIVAGMNGVLMLPSWFWLRARLPPRQPAPWSALVTPWTEPMFVFLALGAGMSMLNMFTPYFDAPIMAASNRLSPAIRHYSIAILQVGSFLGRASSGLLADRFGAWRVYVAMALLTAGTLFAFWCATPIPAPAAVVGLWTYGFTSGAWITLVSAVTAAISPQGEIGTWIGVLWTAISPPILAGPVVSGVLIEMGKGAFTYAGVFCGGTYLVGTAVTAIPVVVRALRKRKVQEEMVNEEEKTEVVHQENV